MNRTEALHIAAGLNSAIWLRDHIESLSRDDLVKEVESLASYEMFSSRQISAIINGRLSPASISGIIGKTDKTGGNLNPGTLEILRAILYSRADKRTDRRLIKAALGDGNSQGMIAKLTGVSQSLVSKIARKEEQ
jgi:hypothetical protein